MQFHYFNHSTLPIPVDGQVQDIVILRTSVVVFYLQRYVLYNTQNIQSKLAQNLLKNKIVKPRQVDEELIAAVQPRGKLIILNPYKNEVIEIIDIPLVNHKTNSQWFFFNKYYIFPQSKMFTYRQDGYGNSIGLATFKGSTKILGFKYNIQVSGGKDTVCSSIDQFDNNCTFVIYQPILKRYLLNLQLLTVTNNSIAKKSVDLTQIFNLHKNIYILFIKMINEQLFMLCLKSETVKSLFLFVNQVTEQIIFAIQSKNKFMRPLFEIRNDPQCFLFESVTLNPPSFNVQTLVCKGSPSIQKIDTIIAGDILVDYFGRRVYKWWTDNNGQGAILHTWSILNKKALYFDMIRKKGIFQKYGDALNIILFRLLA